MMKPKITREAFIKRYAKNSGVDKDSIKHWGIFCAADHKRYALPCNCGDESCDGWGMLSADSIPAHLELHCWSDPET
jgi:hypothetical protein